jgi:hypothetical protein
MPRTLLVAVVAVARGPHDCGCGIEQRVHTFAARGQLLELQKRTTKATHVLGNWRCGRAKSPCRFTRRSTERTDAHVDRDGQGLLAPIAELSVGAPLLVVAVVGMLRRVALLPQTCGPAVQSHTHNRVDLVQLQQLRRAACVAFSRASGSIRRKNDEEGGI